MTDNLRVRIVGNEADGYSLSLWEGDERLRPLDFLTGRPQTLRDARRLARHSIKRERKRRSTQHVEIVS